MSKSCCDPKKGEHRKKGAVDPFIIGIVVATTILFLGAVYFGTQTGKTTAVEPDAQATLAVAEDSHDWGTIGIDDGVVSKTFTIENTGESPLKLYEVKTSCMCTTAQLVTPDNSSKKFGMHEKGSSVFEVNPGEMAELLVEFDPAFHGPSGVGSISRTITMKTNDLQNPELSFRATAEVVRSK